jgi:NAD(P)-dependent dehydrogenase (short-subunit alcohol dehydrogenase family)
MSERMKGKTVLITGADGGIGLATAHSLVREGAAVAIVDLDAGRAEQPLRISEIKEPKHMGLAPMLTRRG